MCRLAGSTAQAPPGTQFPLLLLVTRLGGRDYDAHFPDEEMEAQRG